jgi:hypothetical protein
MNDHLEYIQKRINEFRDFYKAEITQKDIDTINAYAEEHCTDSHQVSDLVECILKILVRRII